MIDTTPSVRLLYAMQNQNLGWFKALAELIDNAFDANATRVLMTSKGNQLLIEDDGAGIKDIASVLRLGDHNASDSTALGMYGVGLKDAWLFAGNRIEIYSTRNGERSFVAADVSEMISNKSWKIADPQVSKAENEVSGTSIHLFLSGRRKPQPNTMSKLAWAFTPALLQGKQIAHRSGRGKAKTLAPIQLPPFADSVADSFDINGKQVSIEIGIVADGQKMENGPFWIQYKHRNLAISSIGIGPGFDGRRMGGVIRLGDGFAITKNKDDFDDHKEDLHDAIHDRIKMLLQKAEQLCLDVESRALTTELESRINDAIGKLKREKRNQTRESIGTVLPRGTGRKRRKARDVSDIPGGVNAGSRKRHGLSVGFYDMDGDVMGRFDHTANRITLNESHPYIDHCRNASNIEALHTAAIAILANDLCNRQGSNLTLFEIQDFSQAYGAIMRPMAEALEVQHAKRG